MATVRRRNTHPHLLKTIHSGTRSSWIEVWIEGLRIGLWTRRLACKGRLQRIAIGATRAVLHGSLERRAIICPRARGAEEPCIVCGACEVGIICAVVASPPAANIFSKREDSVWLAAVIEGAARVGWVWMRWAGCSMYGRGLSEMLQVENVATAVGLYAGPVTTVHHPNVIRLGRSPALIGPMTAVPEECRCVPLVVAVHP